MDKPASVDFLVELFKDMGRCEKYMKDGPDEDDQFWYRMVFRAFFGLVEAWASYTRRYYIPAVMKKRGKDYFNSGDADHELFTQLFRATDPKEWVVQDNGKPKEKNRKTSFQGNFKACVRLLYLCHNRKDSEVTRFLNGDGWKGMQKASEVRDGLMHPHDWEDITITTEAIDEVGKAVDMMGELIKFMLEEYQKLPSKK